MNEFNSSCVMLSTSLWTCVDLFALFNDDDLKDTGVELNSHITLLFSSDRVYPKSDILDSIKRSLGDTEWDNFKDLLKSKEKLKVTDYFDLSKFENDSDYVILRLRDDSDLFRELGMINKGLSLELGIKGDYGVYKPHMTLAELEPGAAKKYMFKKTLTHAVETALFSVDDLVISYGIKNKSNMYKEFNLTSYNAVDRYFRQQQLQKNKEALEKDMLED